MIRRRTFIRKLLADTFAFAILHSILSMGIFLISHEMRTVVMTVFLAVPFFLMSLVRGKVRNFFLFLAAHAFLIIVAAKIPLPVVILVPSATLVAIGAIYSLVIRLKGGGWELTLGSLCFGLGTNILMAVLLEFNGIHEVTGILTFWAFIMIVCWSLYTQMIRVDDATGILYGQPNRPVGSIVRSNNIMVAIYLVLTAIAAFLSQYFPLGSVITFLKNILLSLLRLLTGLFKAKPAEEMIQEQPPQTSMDMTGLPEAPYKAPAEWLQILEKIFFITIQVIIWVGLVTAVVYGVYKLYQRFNASSEADGDTREYIGPSSGKDGFKRLFREIRDRIPTFGGGERGKIRRAYYKKVRRHMRRGIQIRQQDTPAEIAQKISSTENIQALTQTYQQARYHQLEAGHNTRLGL